MATTESNKTDIDRIVAELIKVKSEIAESAQKAQRDVKLPCKYPSEFSIADANFKNWANSVDNFLATKSVLLEKDKIRCMLTFLSTDAYNHVTRVISPADLEKLAYFSAVDKISAILEVTQTTLDAQIKLGNLKQGNLSLKSFILEAERLVMLAFPENDSKKFREITLQKTLLTGVKSRSLAFFLYNYRKKEDGTDRPFSDIAAKALELDNMEFMDKTDEVASELDILNINAGGRQIRARRCFICRSVNHIKYQCPYYNQQDTFTSNHFDSPYGEPDYEENYYNSPLFDQNNPDSYQENVFSDSYVGPDSNDAARLDHDEPASLYEPDDNQAYNGGNMLEPGPYKPAKEKVESCNAVDVNLSGDEAVDLYEHYVRSESFEKGS